MKNDDSKIGKWSLWVKLRDGNEYHVYCHITSEKDLEAECLKHFGDSFVKITFQERLK